TIETEAFTTCSSAQISGMYFAVPATFVSFNSRNASVELPSVKSVRITKNDLSLRGSGCDVPALSVRLKPDATTPPPPDPTTELWADTPSERLSVRLKPDATTPPSDAMTARP